MIGICLNRLLLPVLRTFVAQEIPKHYATLKSAHGIDAQVFGHFFDKDGSFLLNYGSINNNWGKFKRKDRLYDYKVNTAEDLAKLYLEPHMAKFTGMRMSGSCLSHTKFGRPFKQVRKKGLIVCRIFTYCNIISYTSDREKNWHQMSNAFLLWRDIKFKIFRVI